MASAQKIVRPSFIYESKTPDSEANMYADSLNNFLSMSLRNQLKSTAVRQDWIDANQFPSWAIWGYVCPDSEFKGDERLMNMLRKYFEHFRKQIIEKDVVNKTNLSRRPLAFRRDLKFSPQELALGVYEISIRPEISAKIGNELVNEVKQCLIDTYERAWEQGSILRDADEIVRFPNMATHDMGNMMFAYLLSGDKKYLEAARATIKALGRIQKPNGMFPYRSKVDGEKHCEYENMYYRSHDVLCLFIYWWLTDDGAAKKLLEQSIPFNPLNIEPPYFYNGGPDTWWKVSWRTYWSGPIAMIAAATGDGENATIARNMAKDRVSSDRFHLLYGSLAYHLMAEVKSKPVRNNYIVADEDVRGLRLRYSNWSSTLCGLSYLPTHFSAMFVIDAKGESKPDYNALIMARPVIRTEPQSAQERAKGRYKSAFCSTGPDAADVQLIRTDAYGAALITYQSMNTGTTWRDKKHFAPCLNREVWVMTEYGSIGLITSEFQEDMKAHEYMQAFRFRLHDGAELSWSDADDTLTAGNIILKVWDSNLPYKIQESTRLRTLARNNSLARQLALSTCERDLESGKSKSGNDLTTFKKGQVFYSLISLSPRAGAFTDVKRFDGGFEFKVGGGKYHVSYKDKFTVKVD